MIAGDVVAVRISALDQSWDVSGVSSDLPRTDCAAGQGR